MPINRRTALKRVFIVAGGVIFLPACLHHKDKSTLALRSIRLEGDQQETLEEGCLSLPGVHVDVERPVHVRVRALNEYGNPILIEASGLEARVILHEIDHLDGVLVLDRISRGQRKEAMRALREAQQAA